MSANKILVAVAVVGVAYLLYVLFTTKQTPQTAANAPGLLPGFENIEEQLLRGAGIP